MRQPVVRASRRACAIRLGAMSMPVTRAPSPRGRHGEVAGAASDVEQRLARTKREPADELLGPGREAAGDRKKVARGPDRSRAGRERVFRPGVNDALGAGAADAGAALVRHAIPSLPSHAAPTCRAWASVCQGGAISPMTRRPEFLLGRRAAWIVGGGEVRGTAPRAGEWVAPPGRSRRDGRGRGPSIASQASSRQGCVERRPESVRTAPSA